VTERSVVLVDGSGKASEAGLDGAGSRAAGSADVVLRLSPAVALKHRLGRTTLDFSAAGVQHSFGIGELRGGEVLGMAPAQQPPLAEDTMRQLGEATQQLSQVNEKVTTLKVDPSQRDTKPAFAVDSRNMKDVLDSLNDLTQKLAHPNLASSDLEWNTELKLKKLLAAAHPQCPNLERKNWSIARVSGKCTEERLANAKPTVCTPRTVAMISQLKLPGLIEEYSSRNALLVVICLATYAMEQSNYARLVAERAHAELWRRFRDPEAGPPPVRLVAVELSEVGGFTEQYGVKEVPYCLMFQAGHVVYSKRLRGMRLLTGDAPGPVRPRVLLLEPSPANQLKLERNLRRNGCSSDLALDGPQALRLASRPEPYGMLLASSLVRAEHLRSVAQAVRHAEPAALVVAFNAVAPSLDGDPESRQRFLEECSHVFPFVPSCSGVAAVLARYEASPRVTPRPSGDHKQDLVQEVLAVMERGRSGGLPGTVPLVGGTLGFSAGS